jgi:hypothetical protein
MSIGRPDSLGVLTGQVSDLYVSLEDFTAEESIDSLIELLTQLKDLCKTIDSFNKSAVSILARHDVPLSEIALSVDRSEEWISQTCAALNVETDRSGQITYALPPYHYSHDNEYLTKGCVYTRNDLRELFNIRAAGLNNGVYHFKEHREVWIFVTENKSADREQYVDKLVGNTLYWQGQRMGRTDSLIIEHQLNREPILLFYRRAVYEFDGAGFRYEGCFEYVSHSGSQPTSFVLKRAAS